MKFKYSSLFKSMLAPVVAGLITRTLWMVFIDVVPTSDGLMYHTFAKNIVLGHGFSYGESATQLTAYWAVGTSAVYSVLYQWFGIDPQVIAGFNLVLGVLLVLLTGLVAERHLGRTAGLTAAWIMAFWPVYIQFTTVLASELLFSTLTMAVIYVAGIPQRKIAWALVWSALLVAAIYVRSVATPMLVLIPMSMALSTRRWKEAATIFALAISIYIALTSPWKARNEALWGKPGVMATNLGPNMWMGNNPASDGGYMKLPDILYENEIQRDVLLRQEALSFINSHPLDYLKLCAKRIIISFSRESIGTTWNDGFINGRWSPATIVACKFAATAYWLGMLLLGLMGATCTLRRRHVSWHSPLLLTPLLIAAPAVFLVGQDRYHLPLDPFLAAMAGWMIFNIKKAARETQINSARFLRD